MRTAVVAAATLLAGGLLASFDVHQNPREHTVSALASTRQAESPPAFFMTVTPHVPDFPLGRLWALTNGDSETTSGSCRGNLDEYDHQLASGTALPEDALAVELRLEARANVDLQLTGARVRRVDSTPWLGDINRQADNLLSELADDIQVVCMDRRYARSPEDFTAALSTPHTSRLPTGRTVADISTTLSDVWEDLTYTSEEPQPPSVTLFAGESLSTTIQIVGHGGRLAPDREPFVDQMRLELTFSQTRIGDSSVSESVQWTSPPISMLRFLPPTSTN